MILAVVAVHASGIDWSQVGAVVGLVATAQATFIWLSNRQHKQREAEQAKRDKAQADRDLTQATENAELRREIARSVEHLGEVLSAKLETKETVAAISERLARVESAAGLPPPKPV